jgi:hypothetical protein
MPTRLPAEPEFPAAKHQEFYLLFRQQIVAEDNLVNHRMTWLLVLQAFLLAVLGGALSEGLRGHLSDVGAFKWLICFVGVAGSIAIGIGVIAAQNAIRDLKGRYQAAYGNSEIPKHLPPIVGDDISRVLGWVPLVLPILCMMVWVVIGFTIR